ncbi:MAG: tetratricopeptide repeat protein [Fimbriimonadaceae bacterium]|nr:tetratricopeptide repeat protein [Fimbriimonadaceae bacterium]QYK56279.1 MAG: tetratricopeptide repeat protein [Fimbriimonadaceae bacterium]
MNWIRWTAAAAAAAALAGCFLRTNLGSEETGGGGASPIENYKEARMRDALRGLDFSTGKVTLTAEAAKIAPRGSLADGARLAAEADRVFETNDFPAAIEAYKKAVIVAPGRAETYLGLAQALVPKGRSAEAEAAVRTAVSLSPKNLDARLAWARLVDAKGDAEATVAAWSALLAVDGTIAEAHDRLAIATYYRGDAHGALKHIEACERLGGAVPAHFKDLVRSEAGTTKP